MLGGAQEGALAGAQGNPGRDDRRHHRRGDRGPLLGAGRLSAVHDHPTSAQLMAEDGGRNWYVVHTYSGYEHKVKAALEERIRSLGKPDLFGEILVPSEKVVELVKGKKKTRSEEHTSELQSQSNLVCRLLLEKKKRQERLYVISR